MNKVFVSFLVIIPVGVIFAYLLVFKSQKQTQSERLFSGLEVYAKRLLLIFTLAAGAIPPALVVRDRWMGYPIGFQANDKDWWNSLLYLPLYYPRYFLIAITLTVLVWIIAFFWKTPHVLEFFRSTVIEPAVSQPETDGKSSFEKMSMYLIWSSLGLAMVSAGVAAITDRIPGWELVLALGIYCLGLTLKEYSFQEMRGYFQVNGAEILNICIFTVSLCGALYEWFGETHNLFIFHILLFFSTVKLLQNGRKPPLVFWIFTTSLVALSWKINGWEYVVIGDEYSFYEGIRNTLEHKTVWELINLTFNGNFIYGAHPYFSSYIHNFFMKIFGNHNFGWRFSNPFLTSFSLFFYYYFFKFFTNKQTSLIAIILLGFSHYLLSFSKIGYNNLQAFFALGLVTSLLTWALKSMKLLPFALLGLAMGICFYLYPGALYILPIPILGMLLYLPPTNKNHLKRWGWMMISIILLIYPLLIQPKYWQEKFPGTFLYTQAGNPMSAFALNIASNTVYSLFSYLYIPIESHYISTGYIDPLSSIFTVIGAAVTTRALFTRKKSVIFLILGFLVLFVLIGTTHGRPFPTATRMFLLLPWLVLFTAIGIKWFINKFSTLFSNNQKILLPLVMGGIILVNLYNAYVIDISRSGQYHTMPPVFIKTVRQIMEKRSIPPKSYLFVAENGWNTNNMMFHQWVYLVPDSPRQIISLPLMEGQIPQSAKVNISDSNTVIIVRSEINEKIIARVDKQLIAWGKSMCEIKNDQGAIQFQLWHSGDLAWLCE